MQPIFSVSVTTILHTLINTPTFCFNINWSRSNIIQKQQELQLKRYDKDEVIKIMTVIY